MSSRAQHPSIVLIIPYFGPLPSYSNLFFRSCGKNPTVNWFLITDQEIDEDRLPSNVSVSRTTFAAVRKTINQIVGFQAALSRPYKLCDLRPAYGEIFSAEVAGYEYWGYCDMDVLFGD